jgi:hypothetical protein
LVPKRPKMTTFSSTSFFLGGILQVDKGVLEIYLTSLLVDLQNSGCCGQVVVV